jgi:hypothetical protein
MLGHVANFSGEISWKMFIWKQLRRWEDNIKMDLKEIRC